MRKLLSLFMLMLIVPFSSLAIPILEIDLDNATLTELRYAQSIIDAKINELKSSSNAETFATIYDIELFEEYGFPCFRVKIQNNSEYIIKAFTLNVRAFDIYGNEIKWFGISNIPQFTFDSVPFGPNQKVGMDYSYFDLTGVKGCDKISVSIVKLLTEEAGVFDIPQESRIWVDSYSLSEYDPLAEYIQELEEKYGVSIK